MELNLNAIAIIQARMGSTRLPGKVLADICGQPLIRRLIDRVAATPGVDRIIVATTTDSSDDVLVNWCNLNNIHVFRGSVDDVLDRFWRCAQLHKSQYIVRITADDPLKDPSIIAKALELCATSESIDYASNTLTPTYPEGLDIEVVRYRALAKAAAEAVLPSEREHVMPYIWKNPNKFKLVGFTMDPNLSHWRWTVDKAADLELVRIIFDHFKGQPLINYESIIEWLQINPSLLAINAGTVRHEGYFKTLAQEQNNE